MGLGVLGLVFQVYSGAWLSSSLPIILSSTPAMCCTEAYIACGVGRVCVMAFAECIWGSSGKALGVYGSAFEGKPEP